MRRGGGGESPTEVILWALPEAPGPLHTETAFSPGQPSSSSPALLSTVRHWPVLTEPTPQGTREHGFLGLGAGGCTHTTTHLSRTEFLSRHKLPLCDKAPSVPSLLNPAASAQPQRRTARSSDKLPLSHRYSWKPQLKSSETTHSHLSLLFYPVSTTPNTWRLQAQTAAKGKRLCHTSWAAEEEPPRHPQQRSAPHLPHPQRPRDPAGRTAQRREPRSGPKSRPQHAQLCCV